jgi:hypothetical protein
MRQGKRLPSLSLGISALALFVALGGTVYAAAKLDGKAIKVKSLPGNRLKVHSVAANRLKPGALRAAVPGAPGNLIVGSEIDLLSLGQVPEAAHSETAGYAQTAGEAQTAVNAVNAVNAQTVNGHSAGCQPGTQEFAGACWQASYSEAALSAPAAASSCAAQGGSLPEALQLVAFSQQPGVTLASGDEWSGDITNMTSVDVYAVVTVSSAANVAFTASTNTRKFRCVIPLLT